MVLTVLQLIALFIILAFAGHLYVEIDKQIKQAEEHVERLDRAIDEFIAQRERRLSQIEADAKTRQRAERIIWTPEGTGFEHEINSYE